ncbi:MAG: carbon-nitrogen hydrolase family protein [Anaerolineae bacterium]|nr:MAG: carbon-nitrogen hydrolase family protein [Anaerolineae bacterium]
MARQRRAAHGWWCCPHTGDALLARQRPELGHLARAGLDQAWRTSLPDQERASQGQRLWQDYQGIFSRLAAQHGIVLAAGSLLLPAADGRLYHQAALFDTQGELMGSQRACHRSAAERALQVAAGEQLTVFDTAVGRLGLIVGEDLYYPEVARVLALHGAAAFLAPTQRRFGVRLACWPACGAMCRATRRLVWRRAWWTETAPIQSLSRTSLARPS